MRRFALAYVRGETPWSDVDTSLGLYFGDLIEGGEVWRSPACTPVMHAYTYFILKNNVTYDEMVRMVEILSDKNHEIYDSFSNKDELDFSNENYELPNPDILYTFNADIINEYYRYA